MSGFPLMKLATLDIDRTFVHYDNNQAQMKKLLADHAGKVVKSPRGAALPLFITLIMLSCRYSLCSLC